MSKAQDWRIKVKEAPPSAPIWTDQNADVEVEALPEGGVVVRCGGMAPVIFAADESLARLGRWLSEQFQD